MTCKPPIDAPTDTTIQSKGRSATGPLVLIVDDDPELQDLVGEALTEHNFQVSRCSDGSDALDLIRSRPPDVVILDLGLPGLDGLDLLRTIRDMGGPPVIIVTGRVDMPDRVLGLEIGAEPGTPQSELQVHPGHDWFFVLSGTHSPRNRASTI